MLTQAETAQTKTDIIAAAQTTAAITAITLLSLSAGYAEATGNQTKSLTLTALATPAAGYLIHQGVHRPKTINPNIRTETNRLDPPNMKQLAPPRQPTGTTISAYQPAPNNSAEPPRLNIGTVTTRLGSIAVRVAGLAFRNTSTTVGSFLIGLLIVLGVFA